GWSPLQCLRVLHTRGNRRSGALLAQGRERLVGLVVALGVGEHALGRVEVALGVVHLDVVGTVVGVEALLALLLDLLLVRGVSTRLAGAPGGGVPVVPLGRVAAVVGGVVAALAGHWRRVAVRVVVGRRVLAGCLGLRLA